MFIPRSLCVYPVLPIMVLCLPCSAQTTTRVSVDSAGVQSNGNSNQGSISGDGRFIAFESIASNLVAGDTNAKTDVFVRDAVLGATTRVSVDSAGLQGNGYSGYASISSDGRFVCFASDASNLAPGDTNGQVDVFVHDRLNATTVLVSTSAAGVLGNGQSTNSVLSANGRYVAFESSASNLILGDFNGASDIYVKDLITGAISRVSVDAAGSQASSHSYGASISADGRFVAFASDADNLVPGDFNFITDVFVYDRFAASIQRVSVSSSGVEGDGSSTQAAISGDGSRVAFVSTATNLVVGDSNGVHDVFIRSLGSGLTTRISKKFNGAQTSLLSTFPSLSYDGRYALYLCSDEVIPGPSNQAYLYDSVTSSVLRVSTASGGIPSSAGVSTPVMTANASHVVFISGASDIVAGDTNNKSDVFVCDIANGAPFVQYCSGDGSATACPCGNAVPAGSTSGCTNSTGAAAVLAATGIPSVSSDSLVLLGTGMPLGPCLYFQGTAKFNNGLGVVFGDGLRCAAGTVVRFDIVVNTTSGSSLPSGSLPAISFAGSCTPGATRFYQAWYRDSAAFCAPETFNLSNGLALAWRP